MDKFADPIECVESGVGAYCNLCFYHIRDGHCCKVENRLQRHGVCLSIEPAQGTDEEHVRLALFRAGRAQALAEVEAALGAEYKKRGDMIKNFDRDPIEDEAEECLKIVRNLAAKDTERQAD